MIARRRSLLWLSSVLALTAAIGCTSQTPPATDGAQAKTTANKGTPTSPHAKVNTGKEKPSNPKIALTQEAGVVSGVVRWSGAADAKAELFAAKADSRLVLIGGQRVTAKPTPRLRIHDSNQGVADVVVMVLNPPASPVISPLEGPRVVQTDGDFRPPVQWTTTGSKLELVATDDMASYIASGAAEFSVTVTKGKQSSQPLSRPGLVTLRSDTNPWQAAYVWVVNHGYCARTEADGRFRLPSLPPGEYELVLWHAGWRVSDAALYTPSKAVEAKAKVVIGKGQGATVEWLLSSQDAD